MSVPYADNIVFNFSLYNNENNNIPAELYISRDQAFIDRVEDYYIRLVGAQIPTELIPLFIYEEDMYVSMINDGVESIVKLEFPEIITGTKNYVLYLQQFLNSINTALRTAHINSGCPGNPPLFIYDNEEMKFVVDQQYSPNIQSIGFNTVLINKLPPFVTYNVYPSEYFYIQYGQYGINLYNSYPGGIDYPIYLMRSNVTQYGAAQEFFNIIITCSSIPVNKQQLNNTTIATRTLGILDVVPIKFEDITKFLTINYKQEFPVYNDLLSRGKLSEIDFKLYIVDKNYRIFPLNITPKTSITCRIEFINKKIVKNYYPLNEEGIKAATSYIKQ